MSVTPRLFRRPSRVTAAIIAIALGVLAALPATAGAVAAPTGTVSGRVIGSDTGAGVANVLVFLMDAHNRPAAPDGSIHSDAFTDANGDYTIDLSDATTGSYQIRIDAEETFYVTPAPTGYFPLSATSHISGKNATLIRGHDITGVVTGTADPAGAAGFTATLLPLDAPPSAPIIPTVTTAADGRYGFQAVAPGSYKLKFSSCSSCGAEYASQYWGGGATFATAATLVVPADNDLFGIDGELSPGAAISGTVTAGDQAGVGIAGVRVIAQSGDSENDEAVQSATAADGSYRIAGLAPGSYTLRFDTENNPSDYVSQYWPSGAQPSDATEIVVAGTSGITRDVALQRGGAISGTITGDVAGSYEFEADAYALDSASGKWVQAATGHTENDGSYTIPGLGEGSYKVGFHDYLSPSGYAPEFYDNKLSLDDAKTVTVSGTASTGGIDAALTQAGPVATARLAGIDRFATSAAVADEYPPFASGTGFVYVADGLDFPDALSAAPAAAFRGAPLLLTAPTTLPAAVKSEIERLNPNTIVVVGGTGVVSDDVYDELGDLAPHIEREAGDDRYATSRAVTEDAFGVSGADDAFIATGSDFPDALAASAAAGAVKAPVVLVNGVTTSVDAGTRDLLADLGTTDVFVAGGAAVVSAGLETGLGALPSVTSVTRLAGDDRYATSGAINRTEFTSSGTVYLAVGTGYADALAGAALAGKNHAPLYVVPGTCVPSDVLQSIALLGATRVVLLGGTGALSDAVSDLRHC